MAIHPNQKDFKHPKNIPKNLQPLKKPQGHIFPKKRPRRLRAHLHVKLWIDWHHHGKPEVNFDDWLVDVVVGKCACFQTWQGRKMYLEVPKTGNHKLSFYTKHMTYLMYPGMFVSNSQPWGMIPRFKITIWGELATFIASIRGWFVDSMQIKEPKSYWRSKLCSFYMYKLDLPPTQ